MQISVSQWRRRLGGLPWKMMADFFEKPQMFLHVRLRAASVLLSGTVRYCVSPGAPLSPRLDHSPTSSRSPGHFSGALCAHSQRALQLFSYMSQVSFLNSHRHTGRLPSLCEHGLVRWFQSFTARHSMSSTRPSVLSRFPW